MRTFFYVKKLQEVEHNEEKKIFVILFIVALTVLALPLGICIGISGYSDNKNYDGVVEVWNRTDIVLNSEKTYENPYLDVEITAVMTHTDGTEIKLYGFWNGENEYRVRFAPTKTGVWNYVISCSDSSNTALHNIKGTILAVENDKKTGIDEHGFVRISDNGRYFVYDDGTPFYGLGDTNWQAPNYVSVTQCNYPGCSCSNQFKHEVGNRVAKGFTVYQTYFDRGESDGGGQLETTSEPSMWLDKYDMINPETFSEKYDYMFDYLAEKGMVIALGLGVHSNTTSAMSKTEIEAISKYIAARYSSYPIVWITAQEITGEPQYEIWKASAEVVDEVDGYNHPQGAHMFVISSDNSFAQDLDEQPWHEFWALQSGHAAIIQSKEFYEGYWNNTNSEGKIKPYIETEANYEDITCGGFNGYDASRISAWKANLLGSYGLTYGATGIWANNYSTAGNTGWYGSFSFEPWYMGLDKPGSYEMTYLRNFFEYVDFSKLVPRFNDESYSSLISENKLVSSSDDGSTYVAYFYNAGLSTGELRGLDNGKTYSAKWYNPLTGKFIDISDDIDLTQDGTYSIPSKPTSGDWALLVTSRTDLGEYETEEPYTDELIDDRINLALDAQAWASTDNGAGFTADKAVDGNTDTYWCAKNGTFPQWLRVDLFKTESIRQIQLLMHSGNDSTTERLSLVISGSDDGVTWYEIYSASDTAPIHKGAFDLIEVDLDENVNYRYLEVKFSDIVTNWATLYELRVYSDLQDDSEAVPGENFAYGKRVEAGSDSGYMNDAQKAVDGKSDTYWCASGEAMPQYFSIDFGRGRIFNTVEMELNRNTTALSFEFLGSSDGESWQTIKSFENYIP